SRSSSTAPSIASSATPAAGPAGGPPPLLTRTSIPPNAPTVFSTSRARSFGTVRSPRTASAPMRSASRSSRSRRRANIATFAPSAASASAIASPMPEEAPQTIAVLPRSPRSIAVSLEGAAGAAPCLLFPFQDLDDVAHGRSGLLEHPLLVGGQLELDDLRGAAGADLHRHAHVEAVDAVLAGQVRSAGKDALLVEHDRVDHLRRCSARRVPGRGAEQVDDLAA